ncbi:MAG: pseudouridine synthase, partial [Candidatus Izemoplasmataceae bacterium]
KYLTYVGYCSRREADRLIKDQRVMINDEPAQLGSIVNEEDNVFVDGKKVHKKDPFVYLAFHKPKGIISTSDPLKPNNIINALNYPIRVMHVGRLDKDSEGLILMTNDGDIINKILRSEFEHEKEYIVKVHKKVTSKFLASLSKGVPILNTTTKPCKTKMINDTTFSIILTEGLNRQIRRMCQVFDYKVVSLKRVRIMHIVLDVEEGKYRHLTKEELNRLYQATNHEPNRF